MPVSDTPAAGHCRKCGDELRLGLPIDLDVFIAAIKQFEKTHERRCGKGNTFTGPLTPTLGEQRGE